MYLNKPQCNLIRSKMINPRIAVKLCRVCGDKASAFNFNGLTCECCKIFFRRNAITPKKLKCRRDGACKIDFTTRKCCPACRLEKCFSNGMRFKDKTVNNLLENNIIILESLNNSSKSSLPKSPENDENLRHILENSQNGLDLNDLIGLSPETTIKLPRNNMELDLYELSHLEEVQKAISIFENEDALPIAGSAESMIEVMNLPCNYARRIVKFCKNISAFKQLCQGDQFLILKPFYFEICAIRFAYYYDMELDVVPMYANETGNQVLMSSFKMFDNFSSNDIAMSNKHFMQYLCVEMEHDPIIRDLLIAQFLFKPRENVTCPEFLRYRYFVYGRLLRRYFEFKYKSATQAEQKYDSLMNFLNDNMVVMRENLITLLKELDINQMTHLMVEVFNLN